MTIRAVLFDCDGVLQTAGRDWVEVLTEVGGPDFPWALFEAEAPSVREEVPLRTVLQDLAQTWTLTTSPDELLALWTDVRPDEAAWRVVDDVLKTGAGVLPQSARRPRTCRPSNAVRR